MLFIPVFFIFFSGNAFKIYVKSVFGSSLHYESINIEKGRVCLKNISISNEGYDLKIEEALVGLNFSIKDFELKSNVVINQPTVTLKGGLSNFKFFKRDFLNKKRFFKTTVNVNDGKIFFREKEPFTFFLSQKSHNSPYYLTLRSSRNERSEIVLEISKEPRGTSAFVDIRNVSLGELYPCLAGFSENIREKIEDVKGNIDGTLSYILEKNSKPKLSANLSLSDFSAKEKLTNKLIKTHNLKLSLNSYNQNSTSSISGRLFKNIKIALTVDKGNLFDGNEAHPLLQDLSLDLFYNPGLGPKIHLKTNAYLRSLKSENKENSFQIGNCTNEKNIEEEKIVPLEFTSIGYFCSDFCNWIDFDLKLSGFDQEKSFSLNLQEKNDSQSLLKASFKNFGPEFFEILRPYLGNNKFFNEITFTEGNINSEIEAACFSDKKPQVSIKKLCGQNILLSYKKDIILKAQDINGTLDFDLEKGLETTLSSNINISNSNLFCKFSSGKIIELKDIFCSFVSKEGVIFPSSITSEVQKLKTSVKLNGKISELIANAEIKGSSQGILSSANEDQLSSVLTFRRKNEGGYFSGVVQLLDPHVADANDQGSIVFGVTLKDIFSLDFKNVLQSLWLRGENLNLEKFQAFLPEENSKIKGKVNLIAYLQKQKFSLQWQAKNLEYENKYYSVSINKVGSNDNNFLDRKENFFVGYDLITNRVDVEIPLVDGNYFLKKFNANFNCKNAKIRIQDKLVDFDLPDVVSENLNLAGKVYLDFSEPAHPKLDIITDAVEGDINNLKNLAGHFNLNLSRLEGLSGKFKSEPGGFYFSKILDESQPEIYIGSSIYFKNIEYKVSEDLFLKQGSFFLQSDSRENTLEFTSIEGKFLLNGREYFLQCPLFSKKEGNLSYDFRVGNSTLDLIRIKGKALFTSDAIEIVINKDLSHFFGVNFDVKKLQLDQKFNLKSLDATAKIDLEKCFSFIDFLPYKYLSFLEKANKNFSLKMNLDENKTLRFTCVADPQETGKFVHSFFLEGRKDSDRYVVDKLVFDSTSASFSLFQDKDKLKIDKVKILHKNGDNIDSSIEGEGWFSLKEKKIDFSISNLNFESPDLNPFFEQISKLGSSKINCFLQGKGYLSFILDENFSLEADLDLSNSSFKVGPLFFENNGPLNFFFSNKSGVKVSGLDLSFSSEEIDLSLLKVRFKYLNYFLEGKRFDLEEGKFFIPKSLLNYTKKLCAEHLNGLLGYILDIFKFDRDLDFETNIQYFPETKVFSAYSKDTVFHINGKPRYLKNIVLTQEKHRSSLEFDYLISKEYHHITNFFDFSSPLDGKLIIGKKEDSIKVYWTGTKDWVKVNRIKGSYCGLSADFSECNQDAKDRYSLNGSLKIDFSKISPLISPEEKKAIDMLSLTSGYELKGKIAFEKQMPKFIDFEGSIVGKDFGIMGYKIKTMLSDIFFDGKLAKINNLKISDASGILQLDELLLEESDGVWNFFLPKVELVDCRPSLLKNQKEESGEIKPLLIKNFKLVDLKGNFSDLSSISGKGDLSFLNSFKRGRSIFEVPSEVLGMIVGLDQELLIPVMGDVFFEIKDKKVLFNKVNEVYSENKRSKFFLVDMPYMDFNGNLNINIKMKQYVLFKITDKFIISIKGNVKKPEYTLKKRNLFQSNS